MVNSGNQSLVSTFSVALGKITKKLPVQLLPCVIITVASVSDSAINSLTINRRQNLLAGALPITDKMCVGDSIKPSAE
jgi:hypothetical protein